MNSDSWKFVRAVSVALVILFVVSTMAFAQLYTGSLTGVVQDPSGAVVPNAKVTITDTAKGFVHSGVTDATGRFIFRSVQPADYKVTVAATGFGTVVLPKVTVNINANATADVTLKVVAQGAGETVEVHGEAEGVQTQDGAVGQVVDSRMINELPLVGRQVYDLAMLAPGVTQATGSAFGGGSGNNFISQGSRSAQADIVLDGTSTTNYEQNSGITTTVYTPSPDSVQEFKVQQTNFGAEFGFTGATVVNVVTRSGTNAIHGSAYEFVRNTILNSNDFFSEQAGDAVPAYHWNNFGFNVGGPVRKDKAFFFFAYDGSRTITPTPMTLGLPTDLQRSGDFSQTCTRANGHFDSSLTAGSANYGMCLDTNGNQLQAGQIYDPYAVPSSSWWRHRSTTPIPFNNMATYTSSAPGYQLGGSSTKVPLPAGAGNLINPVATKILAYLPHVQKQNQLNNNFFNTAGNVSNNDQFDAKIDTALTSKDMFNLRFSNEWAYGEGANILGNNFDANTSGPRLTQVYQLTANVTHTFSPKTILTAMIGGTHSWQHIQNLPFDETTLGLPPLGATAKVMAAPAIQLDGYTGENGNANFGGQPWDTMLYGQDLGQAVATVSHIAGRHELKIGGEVRIHRINFTQWGLPAGKWQFDPNGTSADSTGSGQGNLVNGVYTGTGGDAAASFMTGWATGWNAASLPASPATQNLQYAAFFQDNFHVSSKLTLNLGIRYDLDMPRTERHNHMTYFDPNAPSAVKLSGLSDADLAACPACANLHGSLEYVGGKNPRTPFDTYYGGVGPRVGFAYSLPKNTVIRGGFGIYYDPSKGGAAGTGTGLGGFQGYDVQTTWNSTSYNDGQTPTSQTIMGANDPSISAGTRTGNKYGSVTQLGSDIQEVPIRSFNKLPREYTWSLGFEHEIPWKVVLDAEYIGKHGQNLYVGGDNYAIDHLSSANAAKYAANTSYYGSTVAPPAALSSGIAAANQGQNVPIANKQWMPYNGLLPYPQYAIGEWGTGGVINVDPPIGRSNYMGLMLKADKRFSNGVQFLVTYAMQRSMDDASIAGNNVAWLVAAGNSSTANVQDPNNLGADYSRSQYDITKVFQSTFVYETPFGKGKRWSSSNALVDGVLGAWHLSGTYRWDSGQPIILFLSGGSSVPTYGSQRPNLNAPLIKSKEGDPSVNNFFVNASSAVSAPAPYTDGTAPRVLDGINAPGTNNFAMAVSKDFPLKFREGATFKFRWEAFNLFNHVQYAAPNTWVNGGTFGDTTAQANSPRVQQVSLRLTF